MKINQYLDNLDDLTGKKVIITGGTSGIGLWIVRHLLYKHAKVVILARNQNKAEEVKTLLSSEYPNASIEFIKYNQSNFASIKEASEEILKNHKDFYALILNAGVFARSNKTSEVSMTIQTNLVGVYQLVEALLPNLNEPHRFIFQGSFAARMRYKKIKSFSLKEQKISDFQQYIISKSGVEALFYHYASTSEGPLSFLLAEPGFTSTDIVRDLPTPIRQLGKVFMKIVSHSPKKAALTALKALDSSVTNGAFIVPRGFRNYMGYPKIKDFPKKRRKPQLLELLSKDSAA